MASYWSRPLAFVCNAHGHMQPYGHPACHCTTTHPSTAPSITSTHPGLWSPTSRLSNKCPSLGPQLFFLLGTICLSRGVSVVVFAVVCAVRGGRNQLRRLGYGWLTISMAAGLLRRDTRHAQPPHHQYLNFSQCLVVQLPLPCPPPMERANRHLLAAHIFPPPASALGSCTSFPARAPCTPCLFLLPVSLWLI